MPVTCLLANSPTPVKLGKYLKRNVKLNSPAILTYPWLYDCPGRRSDSVDDGDLHPLSQHHLSRSGARAGPSGEMALWQSHWWLCLACGGPKCCVWNAGTCPISWPTAFVLALFNSLWTLSVSLNGAAVSTVLVYCSAGFTALLGWWLLKERLGWTKLLAVVISLGGCVLVSGALDPSAWGANLIGIVTGVLSGLGYAGYSLMGRSASQRGVEPMDHAALHLWVRSHHPVPVQLSSRRLHAPAWQLVSPIFCGWEMPG